jgi:hypothetical protein
VTQSELGDGVGRPQSFVAKYESRERRLDVAEHIGIARKLGAEPYEMPCAAENSAKQDES